jgi:hypothetical protein
MHSALSRHVEASTPEIVAVPCYDTGQRPPRSEAWPRLADDQKTTVLHQIGRTIAQVQRAPLGELTGVEPQWPAFIKEQIDRCRARHVRLGLPPKFFDSLDELRSEAETGGNPRAIPCATSAFPAGSGERTRASISSICCGHSKSGVIERPKS